MIVGYQANGTLGRKLVDGHEQVKIHGSLYSVRAQIHTVGGLSAHGDVDDLTRWLKKHNAQRAHVCMEATGRYGDGLLLTFFEPNERAESDRF